MLGRNNAGLCLRLIIQKQREEPMDGMQIKVLDVPPPILGRPLADLASALGDLYRVAELQETAVVLVGR